jgi:deazaflavin-dependent oxidoreductase (nitroreductase family)
MRHGLRDLAPEPSRRTRLRRFAPITTHVINPVTRLFAGRLPGFGILRHIGRTTGRRYRTPLLVLRRGNDYIIALGSGADVHWVQNVLAAGGCELRTRGRTVRLTEPRIWVDPEMRALPVPLRWVGSLIGLTEFLGLREVRPSVRRAPKATRRWVGG